MNGIKSNQASKQYSKLIRIVHNGMTQITCPFESLVYLNTINIQYSEISSLSLNEANGNYLL